MYNQEMNKIMKSKKSDAWSNDLYALYNKNQALEIF
jgi:hypothetical protein